MQILSGSRGLRICGYVIFAIGMIGLIQYVAIQAHRSLGTDLGIILGDGAIALIGLVALMAAGRFRLLEDRLDRLENSRGLRGDG
jgi:hypothetical protein